MADPELDRNRAERVDHTTTTTTTTTGGGSSMAFIVGALVVVVALLAWFFFSGADVDNAGDVDVNVESTQPTAAEAVDDATDGAVTAPAAEGTTTAPAAD